MRDVLLKSLEKRIIKDNNRKDIKISVLGVGSELRADDAAGFSIIQKLTEKCEADGCGVESKFQILYGATAPENFTGEIKKFSPTHLIIIDAAEIGQNPGYIKIIEKDDIADLTFSTHVLPLSVMVDYLNQSCKFETIVIGIQPKDLSFGKKISNEVNMATSVVSDVLYTLVKELI